MGADHISDGDDDHGRPGTLHVCHGPCWASVWRLADDAAASAAAGHLSGCLNDDLHRRFTTGLGIAGCPARCLLTPALHAAQFTAGSRTTLRTRPPLTPSAREYTPAQSALRTRPDAHCLSCSILSPEVTATGTTFCAAWIRGTSKSDASLQHDLISAPVQSGARGPSRPRCGRPSASRATSRRAAAA